ncbi:uncharacterized protein LOC141606335 [Silene latifolia]|uniref:uncharacterized protein LOC141606335 n=1 Tax=Silene latifolia TaxID=37657 RepID=UPI003D7883F0
MGILISENPHYNSNFTITLIGNNNQTHQISTTVTNHPGIARDWLHSLLHNHRFHRHRLVVGLGVQWTPSTYFYNHSAATIQLCIGRQCLVFKLHRAGSCPRVLRRLLSDSRVTFVGLWNHQDAAKLRESRHKLEMEAGMPIDLRHHVEDDNGRSLYRSTIAEIAEEVLDIDIGRSDTVARSDWEVENLSCGQALQAAIDAFVAYAVGMRIRAWELNPNF